MLPGAALRRFRERYRLSQWRLALLLGVQQSTINRWEHEQTGRPPLLARALRDLALELEGRRRGRLP